MAPSNRGPLREWLAEQSIVSEGELPFDAIVWFGLNRNERSEP